MSPCQRLTRSIRQRNVGRLTSALIAPLASKFCCLGLKSRPRTGPVCTSFLNTKASEALMYEEFNHEREIVLSWLIFGDR